MTTNLKCENLSLFSPGMMAVLAAQFFSALADNAALILAVSLVKSSGEVNQVSLLQAAYVAPFILLAPFVGPVADGYPKGRVMLLANLLKLTGAIGMATASEPIFAYGVVGIGAAVYSPAKYGILTQLVDPDRLVRANGMLEGSTIVAILLGVLTGGWLTDHSTNLASTGVTIFYLLATGANLFIPRLDPERPAITFNPRVLISNFFSSLRAMFSNPDARFSLLGTSIFWGSGATLRLLLFAWAPVALTVTDNQTPANLMGIVSLGIAGGAATAGAWISLKTTNRALIGGLLLGPVILGLATVSDLTTAAFFMAAIGFCGGLFVVPLNALLQETGHVSVGAGRALAVQNFGENLAMLLFVGAYTMVDARGMQVSRTAEFLGLVISLAVLGVAFFRNRRALGIFIRSSFGFAQVRKTFKDER